MKKTFVALISFVIVFLFSCCIIAYADDTSVTDYVPSKGLQFESNDDGTCTITGIGSFSDETLVIPGTDAWGEDVSNIGEYALYRCKAKTVVFSNLKMTIESSAFSSCEFETIIIDNCELTFEDSAMSNSDDVEVVTVTNSTIHFGEYALYKVGDDAAVTFSNSVLYFDESAASSTSIVSLSFNSCEVDAEDSAFAYNDDLESLEFLNSSFELGEYCFYKAGHKMILSMEKCTGEIADSAFSSNEILEMSFQDCDLEIGNSAFAYGGKLQSVIFGNGKYSIDEYAFYKCEKLETIVLGGESNDNEIDLDDSTFSSCKGLISVNIGNGTIELGDNCFAYCDNLSEVYISEEAIIKKMGSYVFYRCNADLSISYAGKHYNADNASNISK